LLLGSRLAGVAGGIIGLICGAVLGGVIGRLPFDLSMFLIRRALGRSSNHDLHERIDREHYLSHLIIAELISRGEAVGTLRDVVQSQLSSASGEVRHAGQRNARLWFPDLLEGTR
jgi:hypothetical protein